MRGILLLETSTDGATFVPLIGQGHLNGKSAGVACLALGAVRFRAGRPGTIRAFGLQSLDHQPVLAGSPLISTDGFNQGAQTP